MDSIYFVDRDGVHEIAGMPPGNGQAMVPHLVTFMGVTAGAGRVYRPSDEALKESRENARYMRADAAVMECVELRQRAVALLDWRIEVEDQSPQYQQTRDLLTKICRRIPRFTQYRETLLQAIWFGRYAVENVFAWDWIDGQKLVSVCGWCPVHGDKLVWKLDARTGRFQEEPVGIRVSSVGITTPHVQAWFEANRQYIEPTDWGMAYFPPPEKRDLLVIHRHQIEDGEWEEPRNAGRIFGVGIRSKIYWVWYQKQQALRWLMEFLERSAFGIELWYYPAGNLEAREETLRSATQRVGTGKNVLLVPRPPGGEGMLYGVERIEPSMSGAQVLKEILTEYFGHQIKRYILGQTLTTEAHATGLGSNLASIHLDTFLQIVRYDAGNLQETLTEQLLWRLIHWNWPGLDHRLFRFCIETDRPDVGQRLEALQRAFQMGLKIRTADLRELLGIDGPAEGEEYVQDPNFRQQAPGQPPGLSNLPSPPLSLQEQFRERYALPEGLPKNPQVGHTVTIAGVTYQFNENHRWQKISSGIFASPNVGPPMSLAQAIQALGTPEHLKAKETYRKIVAEYTHKHGGQLRRISDVVGYWGGGAENSLYTEIDAVSFPVLRAIAAEMGLVSDPPQMFVAVFHPQEAGKYARWTALLQLSLEEVESILKEAGINNCTLKPVKTGCRIILCGKRRKVKSVAAWIGKRSKVAHSRLAMGVFDSFGDENRQNAADTYHQVIHDLERERMKLDVHSDVPFFIQNPWYLKPDDPNWDWKTKAVAAMLRDLYEDDDWRVSPEERKRRWEETGKELEAEGYIRLDEYSWGTPDILEGGEDDDEPYEPDGGSIIA